ncbi:MAG: CBS domain-containing protein [Actinomycetota bacterium]|nr:CBS domain-containing protein [Actinomycetota bacterium]
MERIRAIVEGSGWPSCIVIHDDRVVLGRIRQSQLSEHGDHETAEQIMDPGPSTFRPDVPRQQLRDFMRKHALHTALITTAEGVLVGMVKREDLEPPARGRE